MEQSDDFDIVETAGKRKVLVARKDLLPGQIIIDQEKPAMIIPKDYLQNFDTIHQPKIYLAGFSIYSRYFSAEDRTRFDQLFGPTNEIHIETCREMAFNMSEMSKDQVDHTGLLPFSAEEAELFVKVANVIGLNAHETEDGGHLVMDNISRLSHSCIPNCVVNVAKTSCSCRTIMPVTKGEILTFEFNPDYRLMPTHFRRHCYLEVKGFTCHCPRCDAEADDTREFNCFDSMCPGSCFACQPLNKEPFAYGFQFQYTGVEYVEPHLLPCTVCHRAPPLKYQEDMFKLEKELPTIASEIDLEFYEGKRQKSDLLREIHALHLPLRHSLSLSISSAKTCLMHFCGGSSAPIDPRAFKKYLQLYDHLLRFPTDLVANHYRKICQSRHGAPGIQSTTLLKQSAQKALRLRMIVKGRDCEREQYNSLLVTVLQQMPPQPATTTECMFCGESPLCAAITLKKCARCRQVTYCSAGCQHAHWPLHKASCKKV